MRFDVAGPFDLTRHGNKHMITEQSMKDLKRKLENSDHGLASACGCYVFALRAGKGYTPYYVGQASKRSIFSESLNPSNREKYNKACSDSKGAPVVFFLPMRTPKGRYKRAGSPLRSINFLERWLIAAAINKNPSLINTKETHFLRRITVVGIFNSKRGESTTSSRELKRTLW